MILDGKHPVRFCGFLFLQQALEQAGYKHIRAAENKLSIMDAQVHYLSRYCGEEKLPKADRSKVYADLRAIGYTDTETNLRMVGDVVYVFDTEKKSFDPSVHAQIDSFMPMHDRIRAVADSIMARGIEKAPKPTDPEAATTG